MNKTGIVIIILCTALVIAVVFFTLRENPGMGDIYLVKGTDAQDSILDGDSADIFSESDPGIYVIIPVHRVKTGDTLNIKWSRLVEDGSYVSVQEDNTDIKKDGSGEVAVYLLKRNDSYTKGQYKVEVAYNSGQKSTASFTITGN